MTPRHNENAPRRDSHTPFRYVNATLRYADTPLRYAPAPLRYAASPFRYAAARLGYAKARIRYAHARMRYATAPFRYARTRFRYAAVRFSVKCAHLPADATDMVRNAPPMSNAERQRQFRERNPGYYGRLHRRRRAGVKAAVAAMKAQMIAMAPKREPLMLPAPVELLEIPGINAIPIVMPARVALLIPSPGIPGEG